MLKYDVFPQLVKDTKQNIIQCEVFDKSLKDEVNDYCVKLGEILKLSMLSFMGKFRLTLQNTSKDFPESSNTLRH